MTQERKMRYRYATVYQNTLDELIDSLISKREELKEFQPITVYFEDNGGGVALEWYSLETDEEFKARIANDERRAAYELENIKRKLIQYGYDPSKLDSIKVGDGLS